MEVIYVVSFVFCERNIYVIDFFVKKNERFQLSNGNQLDYDMFSILFIVSGRNWKRNQVRKWICIFVLVD